MLLPVSLYCMIEVRAITVRSCSRDSFEISSSVMPSEKYSFSASALMLTNGSTAMRYLSSGACGATAGAVGGRRRRHGLFG